MNTLPRAITARIFTNSNEYWALRRHWSALMNSDRKHTLRAEHHLLYLALLGKDWRRAFTLTRNPRRLQNGAFEGWGFFRALHTLHNPGSQADLLAPFGGTATAEMLARLRALLPKLSPYQTRPSDFAPGQWAADAYQLADSESERDHD